MSPDDARRKIRELLAAKAVVDKYGARAAAYDALEQTQDIDSVVFGEFRYNGVFRVVRFPADKHGAAFVNLTRAPELSMETERK